MAKIHVKGYFDSQKNSYILRGIPNPLQRVLEFLLLSNCSLSLYLRAFAAAELDEAVYKGSAGRLTTDSVALQFWNGHKRSRARQQYRKNLEQLSLLRPILDNIDLSEEQYQWVNRQYMKIHMEIELAEDIDCNEEKPTCEREASEPTPVKEKPVKPTPVKEKPTPVKEQEEEQEMHELKKPIDEQSQ